MFRSGRKADTYNLRTHANLLPNIDFHNYRTAIRKLITMTTDQRTDFRRFIIVLQGNVNIVVSTGSERQTPWKARTFHSKTNKY